MGGATMVEKLIALKQDWYKPQANGKKLPDTLKDIYDKIYKLEKRVGVLESK